jgi:hypothetical protein
MKSRRAITAPSLGDFEFIPAWPGRSLMELRRHRFGETLAVPGSVDLPDSVPLARFLSFVGHTMNRDMRVPRAEPASYENTGFFSIGRFSGFQPSHLWLL